MGMKYFINEDGHIWSINAAGESNFPGAVKVQDDRVLILGPDNDGGHEIREEYVLYRSLRAIVDILEPASIPKESFREELGHNRLNAVEILEDDFENVKAGITRLISSAQTAALTEAISAVEHIKIDGRGGEFDKGVDEALTELRELRADFK